MRLALGGRGRVELDLAAGLRIDQAGRHPPGEDQIEARLVAGDAHVDLVGAALARLVGELGVGQHRPRHRHEIGVAARQDRFGHLGRVDAVGGDDGDAHRLLQPPRRERPGRARHLLGNGRHARLVPADALVDDVGAGGLDGAGLGGDLLGGQAALHQVDRGHAEDDEEVAPDARAHGGA